MFAKIFSQIFDSSIAEDAPTRHIFMDLLVLADSDGVVDMTAEAIARRINVPIGEVSQAIERLSAPDAKSRSQAEQGRRIALLDPRRAWGWWIVNHGVYRNLRDEQERRRYQRDYHRRYRAARRKQASGGQPVGGEPAGGEPAPAEPPGGAWQGQSPSTGVNRRQPPSTHTEADTEADTKIQKHTHLQPGTQAYRGPRVVDPGTPACRRARAPGDSFDTAVERIYQAYPRKVGRRKALGAIRCAIARIEPGSHGGANACAMLLERTEAFARSAAGRAGRYTPHPATWFSQERYEDDPREWERDLSVPPANPPATLPAEAEIETRLRAHRAEQERERDEAMASLSSRLAAGARYEPGMVRDIRLWQRDQLEAGRRLSGKELAGLTEWEAERRAAAQSASKPAGP